MKLRFPIMQVGSVVPVFARRGPVQLFCGAGMSHASAPSTLSAKSATTRRATRPAESRFGSRVIVDLPVRWRPHSIVCAGELRTKSADEDCRNLVSKRIRYGARLVAAV